MNLTLLKEINILGYSGSYLSLLFESLTANNFTGIVNILMNDQIKRADAPFETNIKYKVFHYTEVSELPIKNFVFCSNKPSTKQFLFDFFQKEWNLKKEMFLSFNHPSAVIASTVLTGNGFYMEPLSIVSPYTQIGFGVTINRNCSVGHHNVLHDYCSLHPGANLSGNIEILEGATIGPGCTVFSNTKIGKNSIIGGGSVVSKDIPDNVLAFGNPCKIIKNLKV